jgi:hypothetical protein
VNRLNRLNDKICPLCGQPNYCKAHDGDCWCTKVKVPKELIEKVPEDKKGKACICKTCIDKYNNG